MPHNNHWRDMNHREVRKAACQQLFAGFEPDYAKARNKQALRQIRDMAADGLYSHEIAEALGMTPKAVQKTFRRHNFPELQNYCPPLREDRRGWAGGVKEVKGYLYARSPGHPHASKHGGYVAVHRLVLEAKLGRRLLRTEVVDHIDGNPKNNDPDNLRAFASNAEHLRVTLKGRCPSWSPEGLAALDVARRRPRRTWKGARIEPTPAASETDADR